MNKYITKDNLPEFTCICHNEKQPLAFHLYYKGHLTTYRGGGICIPKVDAACDLNGNLLWSNKNIGSGIGAIEQIRTLFINGINIASNKNDITKFKNIKDAKSVAIDLIVCSYWCDIAKEITSPNKIKYNYYYGSAAHLFIHYCLGIGQVQSDFLILNESKWNI